MPIICITPTVQSMDSAHPLFLTFTQSVAGHYDYAIQIEAAVTAQKRAKASFTKCTCGRKANFQGNACCSSRCACVRSKQQCTILCRCKTCKNSLGSRPPPSSLRRRTAYDSQRQPLSGRTGHSFLMEKGESSVHGKLSLFEVLALKAIILFLMLHGFEITVENLSCMYNMVIHLSLLEDIILYPLSPLDIQKISYFLKHFNIQFELLKRVIPK